MRIGPTMMLKHEKIQMVFLGVIVAFLLAGYGVYALVQGARTLVGRGNPPIGAFVTFYGVEARLLSLIYTGGGIWLFAVFFLGKRINTASVATSLSWAGAVTLLAGMISLVVILILPIFQA